MKVKIKKLDEKAIIPKYAKPGDAGMDMVAVSIKDTEKYIQYGTGLSFEIPDGHVGLIFPRSSNSNIDLIMSNSVAVIDSKYRGEVLIRFKKYNKNDDNYIQSFYEIGDRIAQIIIMPFPNIEFEEVDELSMTERGTGGFGSTNK